MIIIILNSILNVTGSQCNSYNIGVIWQYCGARYRTLAAAFLTRCSLVRAQWGSPYKSDRVTIVQSACDESVD